MRLRDVVYLLRRWRGGDERERRYAGVGLLERAAKLLVPGYVVSDDGKLWSSDERFLELCRRLEPGSDRSAERKFFLRELLRLVSDLPGDTAEAGVYRGASSWLICDHFRGSGRKHYAFDSFQGLSLPKPADGNYWRRGDMASAEAEVRALLEPFDAVVCKGWIPEVFEQADVGELCLAHVDVDLYDPTLASLEFVYPRIVPGGVLVCDDYGLTTCPGATRAMDEYMNGREEHILHCPTGQGVIIKAPAAAR
jgi:O-methyltransferase